MMAKLGILILTAALTATGVLVVRQQRLMAVHEMAVSIQRSADLDRKLWRLRGQIAAQISPKKVRTAVSVLGDLNPIPLYWCPPDVSEQFDPPTFIGDNSNGVNKKAPHKPELALNKPRTGSSHP